MDSRSFGNKLELLIARSGWPRKKVATLLGVSNAYISQLIAGSREKPSLDVVIAIAKTFEVSLEWLVDLPEHTQPEWHLGPDEQYVMQLYRAAPNHDVQRMMRDSMAMQVKISGGTVPEPPVESNKQSSE